uniref:Leucine-rich PPR motif-containing protein, mitochondrial n=1 Tax=Denticeps clupeoides TaxID=299321 RepID=A0AAY4CTS6_9TELE
MVSPSASARVLRFSPSPLLYVPGAAKYGPPRSGLYCGAVGARAIRVSARVHRYLLPAWPCASLRQYGVAPQQQGVSKDEASIGLRTKQAQQFDWALAKLDSSVRRTGRVTKTLLLRIFHDICRTGYPSGNQALLLLRSCGSLLPEMPLAERTELAHRIWDKLQELGASYDASHYNALLKVYLQNEHKFSPTDFLAKMEEASVPARIIKLSPIIQIYIAYLFICLYRTALLLRMFAPLLSVLVLHHCLVCVCRDMGSAEGILSVMKGAGIEPGPDTYLALLSAYAEKGDIAKIKLTLETVDNTDTSLMDRDLMQVVFSLAKAGYEQHVPEVVERMRHERGYVPDAMNLCLSLITQGREDTALTVLKTFPSLQVESENGEVPDLGNFFLRHCVNMEKVSVDFHTKELKDAKLHSGPLQFTLYCAVEANKTRLAMELMTDMKAEGLPIRPHFFWPLLTHHQRDKNIPGILEVLRGMQQLEVMPDVETYSNYVVPAFPNMDAARAALQVKRGHVLIVAALIYINMSFCSLTVSSPTFPATDLSVFRGSLISGFKRLSVWSFSLFPAENVAYFLYNLIDSMTEGEVQAKEEKLRQYFAQLKSLNVFIPVTIYRGIRNILDAYHVPELIKESISTAEGRFVVLETRLAELRAEGKPVSAVLKQLIQALCAEEKLERALEIKAQFEQDMVVGAYAVLINLCSRHDNADEAMNLKRELARKDSHVALDATKYLALVRVLSKHGRLEEAIDMLKEMKEKDVVLNDSVVTQLFHVLNAAAMKGDVATVQRLQDTTFALGLVKPTANLCSPLISAHLESGNYSGALEAAMECHQQYNQLPRIHDIICGLVEKGEMETLQKAMDFISQERGEMTMLYDLFFAFMQTRRYKEARKIIETPGLRARPGRLQWFAEKCIANNQMEALENMVDVTEKLFECDRDEMYHYLLRLCQESNDWRKAEAVWTKMQEENVIPREKTLRLLANILKSSGQVVPFDVPEAWYEEDKPKSAEFLLKEKSLVPNETPTDYQLRLVTLCKRGKGKEAFNLLKDADKKGVVLGPAPYDGVIRSLLAAGSLEDAMAVREIAISHIPGFKLSDMASSLLIITQVKRNEVKDAMAHLKTMLQLDQVPSQLAITRLVQGLGSHGDVHGIEEVEGLVKALGTSLNLSRMVFLNNTVLAHIKNGDVDRAVESLETLYTQGGDTAHTSSVAFVFRKVIEENNDAALDKLSAMAERLANHFALYRPATDLFMQYLEAGRVEEAKFMLQRCAAIAEQREILLSYMTKAAQEPGQVNKIKTMKELVPDFVDKETLYSYLMKCYGLDKDLASAKALHDQVQQEGMQPDELFLKRLAVLYRDAGEAAPFQEPPESFKFYAEKLREKTKAQTASADD